MQDRFGYLHALGAVEIAINLVNHLDAGFFFQLGIIGPAAVNGRAGTCGAFHDDNLTLGISFTAKRFNGLHRAHSSRKHHIPGHVAFPGDILIIGEDAAVNDKQGDAGIVDLLDGWKHGVRYGRRKNDCIYALRNECINLGRLGVGIIFTVGKNDFTVFEAVSQLLRALHHHLIDGMIKVGYGPSNRDFFLFGKTGNRK